MTTQYFNVSINATKERVWEVLWSNETYPAWTSAFAEGSRAETDWQKGSKVLFLDGNGMGMVSTIADLVTNEFMSFKHLGVVKDGVEDTESEKVKGWAGAHENYRLAQKGNTTELSVELDINDEFKDYFINTFPVALNKVKEISEKR